MNNYEKYANIKNMKKCICLLLLALTISICAIILAACDMRKVTLEEVSPPVMICVDTEFGEKEINLSNEDSVKMAYAKGELVNLYHKAIAIIPDEKTLICYFIGDGYDLFEKFSMKYDKAAENSVIIFDKDNFNNPFTITAEKKGERIDKSAMLIELLDSFDGKKSSFDMKVVLIDVLPTVTKEQNLFRTAKRGVFTTSFAFSSANRAHNVCLATKKINGTIIDISEDFSYNAIVGERNLKNGFLPAPIIVNGVYTEGAGGGVCQVSSTLYNAALISDLTIKRRANHSIPASYVGGGRDAMVSSAQDFIFSNKTTSKIYILAKTDSNKKITFEIYGEAIPYTVEISSEIVKTVPPLTIYEPSKNNTDTTELIIEKGRNGYIYETKANYYEWKNGEKILLKTELRHASNYPKKDTRITLPVLPK